MKPAIYSRYTALFRVGAICVWSAGAFAQGPSADQPITITVQTENSVLYRGDTFDISKIAKTPSATTSVNTAFLTSVNIGDIRTVNGKAAQGIWSYQVVAIPFRANPQPGQAIADMDATGMFQCIWQIVTADGKYVGTLLDSGASPSPYHIVTGGSGAFLGTTGVHGPMQAISVQRGGKVGVTFTLYPRSRPTIVTTSAGPAVVHQDGKQVTSANPASAGELLTLYATGLGPTTPVVDPGQPFPQSSAYPANAPVDVLVNGQPAEVLGAVGYAGAVDGYQVNFRFPAGIPAGTASLQLTAAWIPGSSVSIATK